MITIVDYGMGNLGSIVNMFKRIGVKAQITSDKDTIDKARKIVLPGVGAFDAAMAKIEQSGLRGVLDQKALEEKVPVLGVCLGMQLLTLGSEEGKLPGLGWIDAYTKKFPKLDGLKVPHMGWNSALPSSSCELNQDLSEEPSFYFVHSFYVEARERKNSMMRTFHGLEFDSGIHKDNVYGVQFHPEKSHKYGMQLFKNFSNIQC